MAAAVETRDNIVEVAKVVAGDGNVERFAYLLWRVGLEKDVQVALIQLEKTLIDAYLKKIKNDLDQEGEITATYHNDLRTLYFLVVSPVFTLDDLNNLEFKTLDLHPQDRVD